MAAHSKPLTPLTSPLLNSRHGCLILGSNLSRHFSSTPFREAIRALPRAHQDLMARLENRQSRSVQMKNMPASKIPNDVGLIPQTFIRPPYRDMPRLFGSTWKSRLKLEWIWLRTRVQNFVSLIHFLYFSVRKVPKSLRMPLDLQSRPSMALDLHKRFYTNLASGNTQSLSSILCSGLATQIETQITHREQSQLPPQSWTLVRYTSLFTLPFSLLPWPLTSLFPFSQAKIVSDRVVPVPMGKEVYIRQCVVRIRSLQSLDKGDGTPPVEANLTEYLVLQRMRIDGEVGDWKIWGTTNASSWEEMAKLVAGETEGDERITLVDRLRQADPTKTF